jgi:hypothetical protein
MTPDVDLKRLERKAFLSYFQDGLWDIFLGLFVLGWGIMMFTDWAWFGGVWFIGLYFPLLGVRKWITYPRLGYAKFGSKQRRVTASFVVLGNAVLLMGILIAVLFYLGEEPQWLRDYFLLIFAGVLALVISSVAYIVGVGRFHLYAAIILARAALHQWLDTPNELGLIISGGIIALTGVVIFIQFLLKYPKPPREEFGGN